MLHTLHFYSEVQGYGLRQQCIQGVPYGAAPPLVLLCTLSVMLYLLSGYFAHVFLGVPLNKDELLKLLPRNELFRELQLVLLSLQVSTYMNFKPSAVVRKESSMQSKTSKQ